MPFCKISCNLKLAAMHIHDQGILSVPEIIDYLWSGHCTFYHVLNLWRTTGDVIWHTNEVHGWLCLLYFNYINYLRWVFRACPDWFLDEMLELLKTNCFISAHYLTIHQELVHAGLSTKKLKKITLECTENLHVDYICHMAQYSPEQVSFLEKILKDKKTSSRAQGQSRKGTCTVKKGVFVQRWCFSTIYSMVANTVVEGSMTWDLFLQFLEFNVFACQSDCEHIYSSILLQDAVVCTIPWLSQCPCHGQCQDSSWRRNSQVGCLIPFVPWLLVCHSHPHLL